MLKLPCFLNDITEVAQGPNVVSSCPDNLTGAQKETPLTLQSTSSA